LFEERAKTAEKAYTACSNAYLTGTLGLDQVLNASNELTNAKLALCKTKDDRFTVRQADVVREKSIEDRIKALANANAKGGEAENLFRASLNRVNAEIALELEKDGAAVR
jgi:hypothetical protein